MAAIFPVILSGGSGTRLWPLSRSMQPKQFIRLVQDQPLSLFGATIRRLPPGGDIANPIILCNNDHRFLVREECENADIKPNAVVLEPVARNTAPAIAVAALMAAKQDPGAVIVVMPSDHVVPNQGAFVDGVKAAANVAASEELVLLGITPAKAHTGYGYIKRGDKREDSDVYEVDKFVEKPDMETAKQYLQAGGYYWNSGIFVLHAATFLSELGRLEPKVLSAAEKALEHAAEDLGFLRLDKATFSQAPSISIDYAVMERTKSAVMLPLDNTGWSDLGSWSSLWETATQDANGNAANGDVILHDSQDCYIHSTGSLVSTIGVKDLVIVDTPDALLVADKSRAQEVSAVVSELKNSGRRQYEQHLRNARPWGFFETLNQGPRFQVKLLHVKPGGVLSMQMHHHRSEHWVVVQGTARVTIDGEERLVRENESVYITATHWHRLENPGKVPLELIEVQLGTYLGEDDIIRSDDVYNRAEDETR